MDCRQTLFLHLHLHLFKVRWLSGRVHVHWTSESHIDPSFHFPRPTSREKEREKSWFLSVNMSSTKCPNPRCTCTDCGCGQGCQCGVGANTTSSTLPPTTASATAGDVHEVQRQESKTACQNPQCTCSACACPAGGCACGTLGNASSISLPVSSKKRCSNPLCTCTECTGEEECKCGQSKAAPAPAPASKSKPQPQKRSLADLARALEGSGDASGASATAAATVDMGVQAVDTAIVKDHKQDTDTDGENARAWQRHLEQEKRRLLSQEQVDNIRKERILQLAMGEGITWGLGAAFLGTLGVSVLSFTQPRFRALQISTKVSGPAMVGLGFFSLKYEHAVSRLRREADREGLSSADIREGRVSSMPVHHKVLNYMYDHPFGLIVGFGLPFAGSVLYTQMQLKHITVSQRVMHSRVFAQGGIISMALVTMAFRGWMDRRGRYPEVQD